MNNGVLDGLFHGEIPEQNGGFIRRIIERNVDFPASHLRLPGKFAVNKQYNVYNVK
jgi:uncharacterized protein YjeT (DUF2065 family)